MSGNVRKSKEKKHYRLLPCADYDLEGLESWLGRMAEKGYFLCRLGQEAAAFERREPGCVRYRLEPKQRFTGKEKDAPPPEEALALCEAYGWSYVAQGRLFYVYQTMSLEARELNTEPEIQAIGVQRALRQERLELLAITGIAAWNLLSLRQAWESRLLYLLNRGSLFYLLLLCLLLLAVAKNLRGTAYLRALFGRLASQRAAGYGKGRRQVRRNAFVHVAGRILFALLFGSLLGLCWQKAAGEKPVLLSDYEGRLPFSTLQELAADALYMETQDEERAGDTAAFSGDLLAPCILRLSQAGRFSMPDGSAADGWLTAKYYELRSPRLADELFGELLARDRLLAAEGEITPVTGLTEGYAVFYDLQGVTMLACCRQTVLWARLRLPPAAGSPQEWARRLARSLETP